MLVIYYNFSVIKINRCEEDVIQGTPITNEEERWKTERLIDITVWMEMDATDNTAKCRRAVHSAAMPRTEDS